jgi:hypothetical protein
MARYVIPYTQVKSTYQEIVKDYRKDMVEEATECVEQGDFLAAMSCLRSIPRDISITPLSVKEICEYSIFCVPAVLEDIDSYFPERMEERQLLIDTAKISILGVPMLEEGEVVGMIDFHFKVNMLEW